MVETELGRAEDRKAKLRIFVRAAVVVAVVTGLLYAFADVPTARLARNKTDLAASVDSVIDGAKHFGQGFSLIFAVALLVALGRGRQAAALAVAVVAAAGAAHFLKSLTSRARPYVFFETGETWVLFKGFSRSDYCSFPSAHTVAAFAFAAALSRVLPRGKWVFVAAAALCGLSRVLEAQHYPSDVFFGAVLGWWIAGAVFAAATGRGSRRGGSRGERQTTDESG